jgi:hypothetical protein
MSGCDKEFIIMLESENGSWNYKSQSSYITKDGTREDSWGLCQFHRQYHPDIVNDKRFFTDQSWQLEQCLKEWRLNPWKFHGYTDHYEKAKSHLIFSEK